ncbi:MAG: YdcF family protein [Armatimonadota bacterium]
MKRLGIVALAFVGLVATLALTYGSLLDAAGRFLIVRDRLEPADAIIVLSGARRDERVRQAAELYRAGYAALVILSGGEEMEGISIPELQRRQALAHGIPASALLLESNSTSTAEQAEMLRPILEGRRARRALVVTSSFHTRRTRYLFTKVFRGSPVEIRVYPVQQDFYSPVQWWTRERDTEIVVLEYIKLGLAVLRRW